MAKYSRSDSRKKAPTQDLKRAYMGGMLGASALGQLPGNEMQVSNTKRRVSFSASGDLNVLQSHIATSCFWANVRYTPRTPRPNPSTLLEEFQLFPLFHIVTNRPNTLVEAFCQSHERKHQKRAPESQFSPQKRSQKLWIASLEACLSLSDRTQGQFQEWPTRVLKQECEVERAVVGRGKYVFIKKYKHLEVTETTWFCSELNP